MADADHLEDCELARVIMRELPESYSTLPSDVLVGFISLHRKSPKRTEETLKDMRTQLQWAAAQSYAPYNVDDSAGPPPPGREAFEALYAAGPVGTAESGAAVVLERIGAIPTREFCKQVTADEMIRQSVYNRQCALAWSRPLSHRHGANLRRNVIIIDLKGFGLGHGSGDFAKLVKAYIKALLDLYPEASTGFFIINTPMIFRAAWAMVSPLLDKETQAKTHILGGPSAYEPAMAKLGMTLTGPLDECSPSWAAAMRDLAAQGHAVDGRAPPPFLTASETEVYACGRAAGADPPAVAPTPTAADTIAPTPNSARPVPAPALTTTAAAALAAAALAAVPTAPVAAAVATTAFSPSAVASSAVSASTAPSLALVPRPSPASALAALVALAVAIAFAAVFLD